MSFDRRQMETSSSSLPYNDKMEANSSTDFKSPNASSFCDQNVKSSTPLSNQEKEYENQRNVESRNQRETDNNHFTNGFLQITPPHDGSNNTDSNASGQQVSSDWFGLSAPKFGTFIRSRIFVGGLTTDTTETDLSQLFCKYGAIKASKIIVDRAGVSKGYGFVTFETERDSEALCNLIKNKEIGPIMLRERRLNVAPAVKKQIGYRSDFPYQVNNFQPNSQGWREGFYPPNGYGGQCNYNPQPCLPPNQLEEYWQVQNQFPGVPSTYPGLMNTGVSIQPYMPVFYAPQPQPYPNYNQIPYCYPDAMVGNPCPPSPWLNNMTIGQAFPSLATQNNVNNLQNGAPGQIGNIYGSLSPEVISQLGMGLGGGFDGLPGKDKIRSFNTNSTTYFPRMADSSSLSILQQSSNKSDTLGTGNSSDDSLPQGITFGQHPTSKAGSVWAGCE